MREMGDPTSRSKPPVVIGPVGKQRHRADWRRNPMWTAPKADNLRWTKSAHWDGARSVMWDAAELVGRSNGRRQDDATSRLAPPQIQARQTKGAHEAENAEAKRRRNGVAARHLSRSSDRRMRSVTLGIHTTPMRTIFPNQPDAASARSHRTIDRLGYSSRSDA